jgi:hypothetical protein
MISDAGRTTVLSSMGWVERDAIWCFDVASGRAQTVPLDSGASYCSLHHSNSNRFVVAHHFEGARLELSVRSFAAPCEVQARAVIEAGGNQMTGDATAWSDVPRFHAEYLHVGPWRDYVLVKVLPSRHCIEVQGTGLRSHAGERAGGPTPTTRWPVELLTNRRRRAG